MRGIICTFLVTFTLLVKPSAANSNGAPLAACETLGERHVIFPSQPADESPFGLFLSKDKIDSGDTVGITLAALDNNRVDSFFKGYMIMAFDHSSETGGAIGMFDNVADTKGQYMSCYEQPKSAVTHVNNNLKEEIRLDWRAPTDFKGEVIFKATFVENYWTFWASVPSKILIVGAEEATTPTSSTTTQESTSTAETTAETTTSSMTTQTPTSPVSTSTSTPSTAATPNTTPSSTWILKPSIVSIATLLLLINTLLSYH